MDNEDDILQHSLSALERGSELEDVLDGIPEGDAEVASLIQLAAAVRGMPHPEPLRVRSRARRRAVLNAAAEATRPVPPQLLRERLSSNGHGPQKSKPKPAFPWVLPAIGISAIAILMVALVGMLGLGVWMVAAPHNAQAATLMDVQGQVEVAADDGTSWLPVASGDKISTGARIRTGAASQATLVFFEGSRTVLGSNADLSLTRVDGDWGKVLRVVLTQHTGKTSHSVVPFKGKTGQFMVFTPSGAASVHGTSFNVAVGVQGASRFMVNTGKVLVSNQSSQVFLAAGQAVALLADQALEDPAYQFTLQGELTNLQATSGVVDGTSFVVTPQTLLLGDPQVGQTVQVEGRILENGDWVADSIETLEEVEFAGSFTGILEDMEGEEWQVGGREVIVTEGTDVAADLDVGASVMVTFEVLENGSWQALKIESLEEDPEDPTETPTPTPDPAAEPVLAFNPEAIEGSTCGLDFDQTARLENQGAETDDIAGNIELDSQVIQGAEYVNGVTLNPAGWDTIAAGDQAFFGIHVNLDEASWEAAPEGTQVEVRVFVAAEQNRLENHTSYLTVTITASCANTETPTETGTAVETGTATVTETATGTVTETATATPEPSTTAQPRGGEGDASCTGADPHPQGEELAAHYGVTYDEIMDWFCQGFGFGEIDRAYGLSEIFNVPVDEVFAMKSSGMGWGNIRKALEAGEGVDPATTPEPIETEEPAETEELGETAEPVFDEDSYCTGASPHPTGQNLAMQYGVPYDEIMGWFCQGFGFGEIEKAYSWSLTYNVPAADIFAMRSSGMGWGQIRKALEDGSGTSNPGGISDPAIVGPDSGDSGNEGDNSESTTPGNEGGKKNNNGKGKNKGK